MQFRKANTQKKIWKWSHGYRKVINIKINLKKRVLLVTSQDLTPYHDTEAQEQRQYGPTSDETYRKLKNRDPTKKQCRNVMETKYIKAKPGNERVLSIVCAGKMIIHVSTTHIRTISFMLHKNQHKLYQGHSWITLNAKRHRLH